MDSVTSLRTKGINKAESPAQPTVEPLSGRMINCKPATVADTAVVDPGLSASNYTYLQSNGVDNYDQRLVEIGSVK